MAVAQRQASPTPSPQHLQCDSQALIALAVQITMAVAHKHTLPTSVPQPLQCDSEPVRTCENPCCGNHNGSSAQRHVANIRAAAITMRFQTSENPCCANHNGSPFWRLWILRLPRGKQPAAPAATTRATAPSGGSGYCAWHTEDSQRHQRRQRAPQPLLEALGTAPATRTASGTSGDNARRSPFWRLWVLRLPRGQPAAPAATTRAAAPSGSSGYYCACHEEDSKRRQRRQRAPQPLLEALGYCACHEDSKRHQRRQRAPQPLLEALGTAPATRTASGTSGDNARRSPFWRLGYCACHEDSQRHQRRQRAPQPLLEALGTAPATKTASGASGDNARRSPFWKLWVLLRLPRGRQQAAPAATTRAAAPSGGSGYCACHEDSKRHQRRQRAPQPLLEALGTAPATRKTASGTSGDNARRSPFCGLWVLRLPRGRQPAE